MSIEENKFISENFSRYEFKYIIHDRLAKIIEHDELLQTIDLDKNIEDEIRENGGRVPERWILVTVKEAYIHCSKHIPLLKKLDKEIHWGTDKEVYKGGDFFKAKKPK